MEAARLLPRVGLDLSCLLSRPWTGVAYYTYDLMLALLAQNEVEAHVFAGAARPDAALLGRLGEAAATVRVSRFSTRLRNLLWTRCGWPSIEYFTGPVDIAHGAFHLLPAARRAKRVVTVFDLSAFLHPETRPLRNAALHRNLLSHAVPNADLVVALSESVRGEIVDQFGIALARIAVVPGGVRSKDFEIPPERVAAVRARLGIPHEYFLHLGTLEPRKNLPRLIEAHARVRAQRACPPLVLAGTRGWLAAPILQAVDRFGGADVMLTGYLPREDACALLRGARACLYPSLYEGFGLPVLEAMAAGTPVLASSVSAMPEVAGDTALFADPTDTDALAHAIAALLDAPHDALRRAQNAQVRARRFTWARSAQALATAYRGIMP